MDFAFACFSSPVLQEFFRGSLSKNPLYSTDILPTSRKSSGSGGAAGGGGSSGGGTAGIAGVGGRASTSIGSVAEATMRNLRDKIATDLDMADAVRGAGECGSLKGGYSPFPRCKCLFF